LAGIKIFFVSRDVTVTS